MGFRLLLTLFLFQFNTYAKLEDAWVYLNDKPNYEYFIENPILILSQKSINMKSLKNIPIDFRDVPINESYIETIDNFQGLDVLSKSKWFNCLHVRGDYEEIDQLKNLAFVDRIEYANRSNNRINKTVMKDKFSAINYDLNNRVPFDQIQMINLDFLHNLGFTGSDISVGVFDAGFRNVDTMEGFYRLRSSGNIKYTYDFVDRTENLFDYIGNSHGTNVLSIIAGYIENEFYGTAIDAEFYLFRT